MWTERAGRARTRRHASPPQEVARFPGANTRPLCAALVMRVHARCPTLRARAAAPMKMHESAGVVTSRAYVVPRLCESLRWSAGARLITWERRRARTAHRRSRHRPPPHACRLRGATRDPLLERMFGDDPATAAPRTLCDRLLARARESGLAASPPPGGRRLSPGPEYELFLRGPLMDHAQDDELLATLRDLRRAASAAGRAASLLQVVDLGARVWVGGGGRGVLAPFAHHTPPPPPPHPPPTPPSAQAPASPPAPGCSPWAMGSPGLTSTPPRCWSASATCWPPRGQRCRPPPPTLTWAPAPPPPPSAPPFRCGAGSGRRCLPTWATQTCWRSWRRRGENKGAAAHRLLLLLLLTRAGRVLCITGGTQTRPPSGWPARCCTTCPASRSTR